MKKYDFEYLDDWYINLYEEWIFIKSLEFSWIELSEIFLYKLVPNIDKKTGFIFLEVWFPKNKIDTILQELNSKSYCIRYFPKIWDSIIFNWNHKILKDKQKIIQLKNNLVKFE